MHGEEKKGGGGSLVAGSRGDRTLVSGFGAQAQGSSKASQLHVVVSTGKAGLLSWFVAAMRHSLQTALEANTSLALSFSIRRYCGPPCGGDARSRRTILVPTCSTAVLLSAKENEGRSSERWVGNETHSWASHQAKVGKIHEILLYPKPETRICI